MAALTSPSVKSVATSSPAGLRARAAASPAARPQPACATLRRGARLSARAEGVAGGAAGVAPAADKATAKAAPKPKPKGLPAADAPQDGAPKADAAKAPRAAASPQAAVAKLSVGAAVEGKVELANRGGVVVRLSKELSGFVPVSQIDPARVPAHAADAPMEGVLSALVGQRMRCVVLDLSAEKGTLVLSEKAATAKAQLQGLAAGCVRQGAVKKVTEYGAFVELLGADGKPHGVEGLLHVSELSWSRVRHPQDVLSVGQQLSVKVLSLDAVTGRVALSLRQLAADPLLETLDTVLPPPQREDDTQEGGAQAEAPLPGLLDICDALRAVPGIRAVTLGRRAMEQRVVSQDLELWLTNDPVADGYNLVARAGRAVQEVHVVTALQRDAIKAAVQRCTAKK